MDEKIGNYLENLCKKLVVAWKIGIKFRSWKMRKKSVITKKL